MPMGSSFSKVHYIYIYHFCLLFLAFICNHLDLASSCQLCCTLLSCCCTHATPMVETWSAAHKQKSPKTSEVGSRAAGEDRNPGAAGTVPTECHSTCGGGTSCTSCSNVTWPGNPRQSPRDFPLLAIHFDLERPKFIMF